MSEFFKFPQNFQWGTATSSYQVEGAAYEGGRSESIWDVFSHTPGIIKNNENGDVACDHYHRWKEDIHLMKELGYKAYRFSVAWPRILPDGRGKINQPGVDFYNRLIDELLKADITPLLTLYHWDIPTKLHDAWLNRATTDAFEEYSAVSARFFGDRVKNWVTINEPLCASFLSYSWGYHAPGIANPFKGLVAAHHLLLAHGKAVSAIRANCKDAQVGIALNLSSIYPQTDSAADQAIAKMIEGQYNRWFIDPLYGRSYPVETIRDYMKQGVLKDEKLEFVKANDLQVIAAPTDFLGINFYTRHVFHINEGQSLQDYNFNALPAPADRQTEMGWEIYPKALFELLSKVSAEYKPAKILITENGASYSNSPDSSGKVEDDQRIQYIDLHLQQIVKAIQAGIPIAGYFVWSFMDNFEWTHGFSQRFGLVYIDYQTQKRTPKKSAFWYSRVIKENGIPIE
jgi:beta-glucosidase